MKHTYTCLLILLPFFIKAQQNFHRFSISAGGGITANRSDLNAPEMKQLFLAAADYYLSPYLHGGLEYQTGTLAGREKTSNRFFSNDYRAVLATGKLHIGEFMNEKNGSRRSSFVRNSTKGIYGGLGLGIIQSRQSQIFRDQNDATTRGLDGNKEVFIPLSIGIDNSGFGSRLVGGLRYQANFVMGDHLDGYARIGSNNDFYSTFTFSLKYMLGPTSIY